ncbi:DUF190 domain-containing protein [Sphingopyxis fribergensis]|uniref:DUF190 domain-containing protein n=1 Tax=Sphingopyxis fribergensis TaxID=1515612 RepID=UPI0009DDD98E|nr:DUF190 domain-containing protein [Sphingopyxis fribergensis]
MGNETKLLRTYTDETASSGDRKVFETAASQARDTHLAGATLSEALIGFGRSAHGRRRYVLESDGAVVIEIADQEGKLPAFVEIRSDMPGTGLITSAAAAQPG